MILRLGERRIAGLVDYRARASVVMVGDTVDVERLREGERTELSLAVPPDQFEKVDGGRLHPGLTGARLQNHRGDGDPDVAAGVLVLAVAPGSLPARVGLRDGDIVVAANGRPARNLSELTAGIKANPRRSVLRFWRSGVFYDVRLLR